MELSLVQSKKSAKGGTKARGVPPVPPSADPLTPKSPSSQLRAPAHINLASPGTKRAPFLPPTLDRCYKGVPAWMGGGMGVPTQEVVRQVKEHGAVGGVQAGWGSVGGTSLDGVTWRVPARTGRTRRGPAWDVGGTGAGRGPEMPAPPPGAVLPRPSQPRPPAGPAPLRLSPRPGRTGAAINPAAAAAARAVQGAEPSGDQGRPGKRGGSRAPLPAALGCVPRRTPSARGGGGGQPTPR